MLLQHFVILKCQTCADQRVCCSQHGAEEDDIVSDLRVAWTKVQ